ncbi:MAG: TolC family protein [Cyclobacteriaceae bacterium]
MRLKGLFFLICLWPVVIEAQTAYTLDECVEYALKNNEQLKINAFNKEIAKGTIGETRALGLPQINAVAGFQDNIEIQTSFIQDFVSPATYAILFQEDILEERELAPAATFPAQFGVPVTGNAGFSVSQMIFNGSYFVGLQAAKALKDLTDKEYIQSEIDVVDAVSKAYYLVLVTQENVNLLTANYQRIKNLYDETNKMKENGFAEKIDVTRLKIQLNNLKTAISSSTEMLTVAIAALKMQMGMPLDESFTTTASLEEASAELNNLPLTTLNASDRIEYKILLENRNLAQLDIKNNKVQYLPNLNAGFNLGWTAGAAKFNDLFTFDDQTWFRYTNWGLTLNVPIFDGLSKKYKIDQARSKLSQVELGMQQLERSFKIQEINARASLKNALTDLSAQAENVELAKEVFRVTDIKFKEGVGSNINRIDADIAWNQAQTNYYSALYNALVAKIELEKTLGILK